jgi:hypothetical protein
LLPDDPRLDLLFKYVKLETGLILGGLPVVFGIFGSIFALSSWARSSFGRMNPVGLLRIVMPSAFALVLGAQIIFSNFFLSILGLRRQ